LKISTIFFAFLAAFSPRTMNSRYVNSFFTSSRILFLLIVLFSIPNALYAANLYFSPSSGSYSVGSTIVVGVYVSSSGEAMNAADGVISFPTDKLEAVSFSKDGSIFSLWVQEPAFSNSNGTVNFEGVVLNPGFSGSAGKLGSVHFRAKAPGSAAITFSSGSILANDGQGTNILENLGTARFELADAGAPPPSVSTPEVPAAPIIRSSTHPNPDEWYALKDAKLSWDVPSDATAARLLIGKIPDAVPNVSYAPPISKKDIFDLEDGVWYFHVRLQNSEGWGGVRHFRLQVDTEPPSDFTLKEVPREDPTEPKVSFEASARDALSGIGRYEFKIDNDSPDIWQNGARGVYTTAVLRPGRHTISAKVFDRAGNFKTASASFAVEPLKAPSITDYPKTLSFGDLLSVEGESAYPGGTVELWWQKDAEEAQSVLIGVSNDGRFTFVPEKRLGEGIYTLWAEVIDKRGARSNPSEKITITVKGPSFIRIGSLGIGILLIIIILLACIALLVISLWRTMHKLRMFRERVRKETEEAGRTLHEAFDLLKDDMRDQVRTIKRARTKRELSEDEERVISQLKRDLGDGERMIRKEVEDIEKEID
ncbi:cohesin domain-containing protein, partial [bacterium]|nr:cohesin domain-containing protein [bacterium]